MKAIIYSRVSTDTQERDGTSLDTQERAGAEYVTEEGWEVLPRIHRSKRDGAGCRAAGESGGCVGVRGAVPERGAVARGR